MSQTFHQNVHELKKIFQNLTAQEKYGVLIDLGRNLTPLPSSLKTPDRIVSGCQSNLYLHAELREGKMIFLASSDSLLSAGLAALLLAAYNGEDPKTVLTTPPDFLKELEIESSISPNRSSGLYQIHLRMKQLALKSIR